MSKYRIQFKIESNTRYKLYNIWEKIQMQIYNSIEEGVKEDIYMSGVDTGGLKYDLKIIKGERKE